MCPRSRSRRRVASSSRAASTRLDEGGVIASGIIDGYSDLSGSGMRPPIGRRDAFVLRYDVWGCPRYHLVLGSAGDDDVGGIATRGGRVALGGFFSGPQASFGGGLRAAGAAPSGFVVVFTESDACCAPVDAACGSDSSCCMDGRCDEAVCRIATE